MKRRRQHLRSASSSLPTAHPGGPQASLTDHPTLCPPPVFTPHQHFNTCTRNIISTYNSPRHEFVKKLSSIKLCESRVVRGSQLAAPTVAQSTKRGAGSRVTDLRRRRPPAPAAPGARRCARTRFVHHSHCSALTTSCGSC